MTKQLSRQAQVAKIMKQECRKLGIKCRAVSESFSMGNSVTVTVYDQPPEIMKKLKEIAAPYESGHFDGMTDMYEYSNSRDDIPQTKYLHVDNEVSDELRQAAWAFMREHIGEAASGPENYVDARNHRVSNYPADVMVHRFLNGSAFNDLSQEFWAARKIEAAA